MRTSYRRGSVRIWTWSGRRLLLVATMLLVLLAGSSAGAAGRQAQERAARKACLTGDYAKGVEILSDLFLDTRDATHIFNQGRCFEQNRRYEDAIGRFEEYLRAAERAKLDQADRAAAERHIAECKERLAQQSVQSTGNVAPPPEPVAAPPPPQPEVHPAAQPAAPSPVAALIEPVGRRSGGSGFRTAGIVAASAGAAALVAGLILNLKVNSMASDMRTPGGYTDGKESDRKTYEQLGWVSYGVGAASVAAGVILYMVGRRSAAGTGATATVSIAPAFAPRQASAVLKGAF